MLSLEQLERRPVAKLPEHVITRYHAHRTLSKLDLRRARIGLENELTYGSLPQEHLRDLTARGLRRKNAAQSIEEEWKP